MLSLVILLTAVFLTYISAWNIFRFIVSLWWVTTNVLFDKDLKKISYEFGDLPLTVLGLAVGVLGLVYWLITFA